MPGYPHWIYSLGKNIFMYNESLKHVLKKHHFLISIFFLLIPFIISEVEYIFNGLYNSFVNFL